MTLGGRAALDKVLAWRGGAEAVATWAQLQSVVELIAGVTLAGIGQGLTVLTAQTGVYRGRFILHAALRQGAAVSLAAAVCVFAALSAFPAAIGYTGLTAAPIPLAVLAGWLAVTSGLVSAYWLGSQRQDFCLALAVVLSLPLIAAAVTVPWNSWPATLLAVQSLTLLAAGMVVAIAVLRAQADNPAAAIPDGSGTLKRYVPIGIAIGILSPMSVVAVRSVIAEHLSWGDAGLVQAFWRVDEWVTGIAAGVLSYVFLPRLGASALDGNFARELGRAAKFVLLPVAALLAIAFFMRNELLALLYSGQFRIPRPAAALFVLGDWVRVVSWVLLNGLIAKGQTAAVVLGEFFSLPLFALFLYGIGEAMTLERVALAYLVTYVVYAGFNAVALRTGLGRRTF